MHKTLGSSSYCFIRMDRKRPGGVSDSPVCVAPACQGLQVALLCSYHPSTFSKLYGGSWRAQGWSGLHVNVEHACTIPRPQAYPDMVEVAPLPSYRYIAVYPPQPQHYCHLMKYFSVPNPTLTMGQIFPELLSPFKSQEKVRVGGGRIS